MTRRVIANQPLNIGGKEGLNIKPDEKSAPFIRRAFDLMATGRYRKTDVLKDGHG